MKFIKISFLFLFVKIMKKIKPEYRKALNMKNYVFYTRQIFYLEEVL